MTCLADSTLVAAAGDKIMANKMKQDILNVSPIVKIKSKLVVCFKVGSTHCREFFLKIRIGI
jgi:hypothetical protein